LCCIFNQKQLKIVSIAAISSVVYTCEIWCLMSINCDLNTVDDILNDVFGQKFEIKIIIMS
jgi:hypothetical protein